MRRKCNHSAKIPKESVGRNKYSCYTVFYRANEHGEQRRFGKSALLLTA